MPVETTPQVDARTRGGRSGPGPRAMGTQNLAAGLLLIALAALALWLTASLPQGTLRSMGPAMLPRWLAIGVGLCGLALVAAATTRAGEALESWTLRGPVMVVLGILAFGATIRPFDFGGGVAGPGLGLIGAGPLAIVIGGYATPEARLRELVVMGLALTAFCMILFGDLLNLPIPLYPQGLADLFPISWSNDARLRVTALILTGAAVAIGLSGHSRRAAPVDVAPHSVRG